MGTVQTHETDPRADAPSSDGGLVTRPVAAMLAVVAVAAFALFWVVVVRLAAGRLDAYDVRLSLQAYALRGPAWTAAMLLLTHIGGEYFVPAGALVVVAGLWRRRRFAATALALSLATGTVLHLALKRLIERPRPNIAPLVFVDGNSFPSGHAMNAVIFTVLLVAILWRYVPYLWQRAALLAAAAALITGIGYSRLYLGAHFPSDIIAGYLAGVWWLATVVLIADVRCRRRAAGA